MTADADNVVLAMTVPEGALPGDSVRLEMTPRQALETARNILAMGVRALADAPDPQGAQDALRERLEATEAVLGQTRQELRQARAEADALRRGQGQSQLELAHPGRVCGLQLESPSGVVLLDLPVTPQGCEGRTLVLRLDTPADRGRGALMLAARKLGQGEG